MFITKHGKPHTLGGFQYLDLSHNLVLALISKPVGLNSIQISQVIQSLVPWDYHLSSHGLIIDLYLVQEFSALSTFP